MKYYTIILSSKMELLVQKNGIFGSKTGNFGSKNGNFSQKRGNFGSKNGNFRQKMEFSILSKTWNFVFGRKKYFFVLKNGFKKLI